MWKGQRGTGDGLSSCPAVPQLYTDTAAAAGGRVRTSSSAASKGLCSQSWAALLTPATAGRQQHRQQCAQHVRHTGRMACIGPSQQSAQAAKCSHHSSIGNATHLGAAAGTAPSACPAPTGVRSSWQWLATAPPAPIPGGPTEHTVSEGTTQAAPPSLCHAGKRRAGLRVGPMSPASACLRAQHRPHHAHALPHSALQLRCARLHSGPRVLVPQAAWGEGTACSAQESRAQPAWQPKEETRQAGVPAAQPPLGAQPPLNHPRVRCYPQT